MAEFLRSGVLSDIHGELGNSRSVVDKLRVRDISGIIHLGDDYRNMDAVKIPEGIEVIQIPGDFWEIYRKPGTIRDY